MANKKNHDLNLLLLILGFFFIAIANVAAFLNPATSYELSIYQQTPTIFWVGIVIGLVLSVVIAFSSVALHTQAIALSLGSFSIISVISLPLIRSYYYFGEADSLSHLGRALNINAGAVSAFDQLYPLSHTLSISIHHLTGMEIRRGLVFLLVVFATIFIIFVPFTARLFLNSQGMINISTFSSLLLLPVNHFTGHMHPHTTSYAILFIPLVIYLFLYSMKNHDVSYIILLVFSMVAITLLHPQQAANILLLFGTVASLQLVVYVLSREQLSYQHIYPHVAIMIVIFWLWTEALEKISGNIQVSIGRFLIRSQRETAGNVRSAVPSLEAAGGSPEEIFIKLFLLGFIYSILSAILMAASLTELFKYHSNRLYKYGKQVAFPDSSSNTIIVYLTFGFVAITGLFFMYILADHSAQYFRHHSFMMTIITILGALSLHQMSLILRKEISKPTSIRVIRILFIIFLLLSVPIIHVSPYLYQESQHVPESQVKGYETAFEHQDGTIQFAHIRSNHGRYYDAIIGERKGISISTAEQFTPPYHFSEQGDLREHYEDQTYLAVTRRDRIRDRELHRGIRYTREDYKHFDNEIGIDRVQDNGGFTLYKINPL